MIAGVAQSMPHGKKTSVKRADLMQKAEEEESVVLITRNTPNL